MGVTAIKVGGPLDPDARIGPMVSQKQWDRVQSYIRVGQEEGATLLVGGEGRPEGLNQGWFVQPTIFSNVTNNMRIAREEIFGPVLCVISYRDEAEAIEIANDTTYGLASLCAFVQSRACQARGRTTRGGACRNQRCTCMSRWPRSADSSNPASAANTACSGWKPSLSRAPYWSEPALWPKHADSARQWQCVS